MTNNERTIKIQMKLISWQEKNSVVKEYDDSLGELLILRKTFWKKAYSEFFLSRVWMLYYKEK